MNGWVRGELVVLVWLVWFGLIDGFLMDLLSCDDLWFLGLRCDDCDTTTAPANTAMPAAI